MGLENREGGKYITILNGKFAVRTKEGEPGAVQRVNKLNNTVWEKFYDSFTAKLVNIRTRDSQYGKSWEFDFKDAGDIWTLQLSYSNSYAKNLIKILPNADLAQEMKLQPSSKVEDGKTKSSLFVSQNGTTLKHAYTRTNPNGMPDMEEILVKGAKQLDDSKQLVFLQAMVERDILPKLSKESTAPVANEPMAIEEGSDETSEEDDY